MSGPLYNGITPWQHLESRRDRSRSTCGRLFAAYLFHGLPDGLAQTNDVIDPRLGLAYSLNSKTVIRTGVGAFHNRMMVNDSTLLGGNAPLQIIQAVTNGLADAPAGSGESRF